MKSRNSNASEVSKTRELSNNLFQLQPTKSDQSHDNELPSFNKSFDNNNSQKTGKVHSSDDRGIPVENDDFAMTVNHEVDA